MASRGHCPASAGGRLRVVGHPPRRVDLARPEGPPARDGDEVGQRTVRTEGEESKRATDPLEGEAYRRLGRRLRGRPREAQAKWKAIGEGAPGDQDMIVECLFRLGRYREAVAASDEGGTFSQQTALAVALALVRLHRTEEARRYLDLGRLARYQPKEIARSLAIPKDNRALEADLHLARGTEMFYNGGDYRGAHEEFKQAYALDPSNLATNWMGFETSLALHREGDKRQFAPGAARVEGVFGDKARRYVARMRAEAAPAATPEARAKDGRKQ